MKKWGLDIIIVNAVDFVILESFFVILDIIVFKKFLNGCYVGRLICNVDECKVAY
jgi:hypothetical protein